MESTRREIRSKLETTGEILKTDFRYKVPAHQRNFSWSDEEVRELWEDINIAIQEDSPEYFLGTIVVQEDRRAKTRTIIDGQQRLATLTMILSGIRTVYQEKQDDRAEEVYLEYLGLRDRRTRTVDARLTLNEMNEPFFQDLVVQNTTDDQLKAAAADKTKGQSNQLLSKAVHFVRTAIRQKAKASTRYEDFLIELEEFIADRVIMILVSVGDVADAYVIFETLNDRGLELSISDLLKNYILGRAGTRHLDKVRRQWDDVVLLLGDRNVTQFLRHYWLSEYGVVRERDLYKEMKKKFASQNAVLRLINELRDAADNYAAILSADHHIWQGYPSGFRKEHQTLQLFKLSQFRPLILSSLTTLSTSEISKVFHLIVIVSMRYSIIGSLGTGNIEKAYSDAAIAVRTGKANTAAKIFKLISKICPDDVRFEEDFSQKAIGKANLARYILTSIANKKQDGEVQVLIEDEKVTTLEHIMPKARSQAWKNAAKDQAEYNENVNRLGNLTLIERERNRAAGRASFDDKKRLSFSKSEIVLTHELCEYKDWTVADIEKRQRELAKMALEVWKLPY